MLMGSTRKTFVFPALQLKPRGAVVIFGGGMTADTEVNTSKPHSKFGGAYVFRVVKGNATFSSGLGLSNSGKTVQIKDAAGTLLSSFQYGQAACPGDKNESVTLSPDITGTCKLHSSASTAKTPFSPGTKADGAAF